MPWKEAAVVELRSEFVMRALRGDLPFVALCREYGISTKTGYKWKERFEKDGARGLKPHRKKFTRGLESKRERVSNYREKPRNANGIS